MYVYIYIHIYIHIYTYIYYSMMSNYRILINPLAHSANQKTYIL